MIYSFPVCRAISDGRTLCYIKPRLSGDMLLMRSSPFWCAFVFLEARPCFVCVVILATSKQTGLLVMDLGVGGCWFNAIVKKYCGLSQWCVVQVQRNCPKTLWLIPKVCCACLATCCMPYVCSFAFLCFGQSNSHDDSFYAYLKGVVLSFGSY